MMLGGKEVTIARLAIQTVLPTSLGPFEEWWERILVSAKTGFNTIHFCPLQEMGGSRSPYSIRDQTKLEPSIFGSDAGKAKENLRDFLLRAGKPENKGGMGLFFIIDAVYNHTSKDTPWLLDHPEACYSLTTAPHLQPAFVLDQAIWLFSKRVGAGAIEHKGRTVPADVKTEEDVHFVLDAFFAHTHEALKLWEFFVVDVDAAIADMKTAFARAKPDSTGQPLDESLVHTRTGGGRFSARIRADTCAAVLKGLGFRDQDKAAKELKSFLEEYNLKLYKQLDEDMAAARTAMKHTIVWERVNPRGPQKGRITAQEPLVYLYFANVSKDRQDEWSDFATCPLTTVDPKYILACNGWVWNMDPAKDFVSKEKRSYLRREVIIWGDSVKLRYGDSPDDNPWLWNHMCSYTRELASMFGGLRIDNCHSTPKHVGQAMMDAARAVNPDILVLAELFTQSEETDIEYTNTLGITSLLLECMSTHSAGDYSAMLHRYGGVPVGSFSALPHRPLPLVHTHPRATLLAASHDNEFPATKVWRSDLPLIALAAMIHNGIGSTRCFEELLQQNLAVVNEKRKYRPWVEDAGKDSLEGVSDRTGIIAAVRRMNTIHRQLAAKGFTEIYIDHIDAHCVSATRRNPDTLEEVTTFAYMVYRGHDISTGEKTIGPFKRSGEISRVLLNAFPNAYHVEYTRCERAAVGGTVSYSIREDVDPAAVKSLLIGGGGADLWYRLRMRPGEVICFEVTPDKSALDHHTAVARAIRTFGRPNAGDHDEGDDHAGALAAMTAVDMNHALFRCIRENETAAYRGDGVYDVPGYGPLKYAGIAGVVPLIETVVSQNDLGHALCNNVRAGDWLLGYIAAHMHKRAGTRFLGEALDGIIARYKHIPTNAKPEVFAQIVSHVYSALRRTAVKRLLDTTTLTEGFGRDLAVAALQFYGTDAAFLMPEGGEVVSMSAGLPHFAAGWMRCWGRDTFLALRGCLLIPKLFDEAKHLILAFARVVRHGLVPNLFDNGNNPRYNCRDATWFFLQSIKDVVGSTHRYTDYQLRPNVAIAMTVAPDLFTPARANHHLDICDQFLVGGMGMRTLDPHDWNYRPNYVNSYDGPDKAIAKGWNYHQGPEWLWPVGFHFRARLKFAKERGKAIHQANRYLARHEAHIQRTPWMGLPELFNENGSECPDSCPTQAWSIGCLIELLHDIHEQRSSISV
ncbi:hypothetical protein PTSG_10237 [Salpingoeca rosetta]|uniref:Glycogen debranching enzyme n=1 Tax=Salpingoeca rosetta (strain ATCC 50818 / BSB-021) TaxID=946362 RepID=F2UQQ0_SALR5|nr:uncharacterized protein PTSG_10237 [Salpingoeca rosetta]EGD79955.1 hypothetical protein PTSG_10237 [Salpingoeca rosetta]|eukprot:XP_004988576.1 hypothetical protein PTSG_10237 [Salpingoeca rosetta]